MSKKEWEENKMIEKEMSKNEIGKICDKEIYHPIIIKKKKKVIICLKL